MALGPVSLAVKLKFYLLRSSISSIAFMAPGLVSLAVMFEF